MNAATQPSNTQVVEKSKEQKAAELAQAQAKFLAEQLKKHGTKSAMIRVLKAGGIDGKTPMSTGQIAKATGLRYQHVRNVLITPVKNPKAAS